ncbi:MAG: hypothetical protein QOD86_2111 [Miltoncostaeaceae bacterium]|jgi:hypothetical protein|nr:hypothetical protein [Miltoncostaeaceae bacterium]
MTEPAIDHGRDEPAPGEEPAGARGDSLERLVASGRVPARLAPADLGPPLDRPVSLSAALAEDRGPG